MREGLAASEFGNVLAQVDTDEIAQSKQAECDCLVVILDPGLITDQLSTGNDHDHGQQMPDQWV